MIFTSPAGTYRDHWGDFQKPGVQKTAEVLFMEESVISAIANEIFSAPTVTNDEIQNSLRWLKEKTGVDWSVSDHYGKPVMSSVEILDKTVQDRLVNQLKEIFSGLQQPPFNRVTVNETSSSRGGHKGHLYFVGSTTVKGILTAIDAERTLSVESQARPSASGMFAAGGASATHKPVLALIDLEGNNFVTGVIRDDAKSC